MGAIRAFVIAGGTLGYGEGIDEESGIGYFVGDHRPMLHIAEAPEAGAEVEVWLHVSVRWLNWVVVLTPAGKILGGAEADEFQDAVRHAVGDHFQGLVINMKNVSFMNSIGFGIIGTAFLAGRRARAKVALCCVRGSVLELFKTLEPNVDRFETEEDAIRFCSTR